MDDFVKVNWDVAVDKNKRNMGIGDRIRERMRGVLTTLSTPKDYIIDPNLAEAMLVLRAATFSHEIGFSKVVLEGDALQDVHALRKYERNLV